MARTTMTEKEYAEAMTWRFNPEHNVYEGPYYSFYRPEKVKEYAEGIKVKGKKIFFSKKVQYSYYAKELVLSYLRVYDNKDYKIGYLN